MTQKEIQPTRRLCKAKFNHSRLLKWSLWNLEVENHTGILVLYTHTHTHTHAHIYVCVYVCKARIICDCIIQLFHYSFHLLQRAQNLKTFLLTISSLPVQQMSVCLQLISFIYFLHISQVHNRCVEYDQRKKSVFACCYIVKRFLNNFFFLFLFSKDLEHFFCLIDEKNF